MKPKLSKKRTIFYSISRGSKEQLEIIYKGVCKKLMNHIFGVSDCNEISRILMENGNIAIRSLLEEIT